MFKISVSLLICSGVAAQATHEELLEAARKLIQMEEARGVVQLDGEEAPAEEAPAAEEEAPAEEPAPADEPASSGGDEPLVAKKIPFAQNQVMEGIGLALMMMLISLSNAGGLSGAGSNIPIMLIFFKLDMAEAVPISAFVAVVATLFRFILNFNQKHPNNPERNCINYEIVQLTMPCVFMGSFIGVILGKAIGEIAQICIFGVTVAWSIKTTGTKALQLIKKEREAAENKESQESLINTPDIAIPDVDIAVEGQTPELTAIKYEEKYHFTSSRCLFILLNFVLLFATQFLYGDKSGLDLPKWVKTAVFIAFIVSMILLTVYSVLNIKKLHAIKERDGYKFDANDTKFENVSDIVQLALACLVAAVLCGCTGIAGGMVLGPLFLKYNMIPQVMSGTNQYITMIASISVAIQFAYIGALNIQYALLFGITALISAYIGIAGVNYYVKKSGKQSVIAILLVLVLVMALVSLPIDQILKAQARAAAAAESA